MKFKIKLFIAYLRGIMMVPQIAGYLTSPLVKKDVRRWQDISGFVFGEFSSFLYLMTFLPEFRNLFYQRVKMKSIFTPPLSSLYIYTREIGEGLFIQHGFSTIISAKKIGKNCWINQQVTIGYTNKTDAPIIGDNVTIGAGAILIGKITVGDNAVIGAGAIVVDDVPANSTVCSPKARVIKTKI